MCVSGMTPAFRTGHSPPHPDFAELVALLVERDHDLVHNPGLAGAQEGAAVPLGVAAIGAVQLVVVLRQRYGLADDDVLAGDADARRDQPVVV